MQIASLTALPRLHQVPQPALDVRRTRIVESVRAELDAAAHMYDGPVLMANRLCDDRIEVYEATYAWQLAHLRGHHDLSPYGLVGSMLMLHDGQGRTLWQQRGQGTHDPGRWVISCAGGVDPGEDFHQTLARELVEELALDVECIEDLRPAALLISHDRVNVSAIFVGQIDPEHITSPSNLHEIAQLRWVKNPGELGQRVCAETANLWHWLYAQGSLPNSTAAATGCG